MAQLSMMDRNEEVNFYCDELEIEVVLAVESAVTRLNTIQQQLLAEIAKYRADLLCSTKPAKSPEPIQINEDIGKLKRDLEELSKELDEFASECQQDKPAYVPRFPGDEPDIEYQEETIRIRQSKMEEFDSKVKGLGRKMKNKIFNNRFMEFKRNNLLLMSNDFFGKLEMSEVEPTDIMDPISFNVKYKERFWSHKLPYEPTEHLPEHPNAVVFLPSGNIMAGCRSRRIKILDPVNNVLIAEFKAPGRVFSLALLPNGCFASGNEDGSINIWNISNQLIRQFKEHTSSVISLKYWKDKLYSCSGDGTIKIWNPFIDETENRALLSINGVEASKVACQLGILSNDYLVTCTFKQWNSEVSVWSSQNGKCMEKIGIDLGNVKSLLVLPDDTVALGSLDGVVQILDLAEKTLIRTLNLVNNNLHALEMISLRNGYLLTASSPNMDYWQDYNYLQRVVCPRKIEKHPKFQLWHLKSGKLVETLSTFYTKAVTPLAMSNDGKLLVTAHDYGSLVSFELIF